MSEKGLPEKWIRMRSLVSRSLTGPVPMDMSSGAMQAIVRRMCRTGAPAQRTPGLLQRRTHPFGDFQLADLYK